MSEANRVHSEYLELVANSTNKAVAVYPELFASKKDYTEDKETRVKRMHRDGLGVPFSVAFESQVGYTYDVYSELADDPVIDLHGKPPAYLNMIDKIFDQPMPKKNSKFFSTLRSIRKQMKSSMVKIELERLKQQISNEEATELQTLVQARMVDLQKLLPS